MGNPFVTGDGVAPIDAHLSVIIVDDNEDLRTTMRDLLESWGHTVDLCEDGQEGLDLIVHRRPDVAIVDLGLPGLDGYAVAARVRARLGQAAVRLVAMSGFGAAEAKRRAFEAGFDEYLVKPATASGLKQALASARPANIIANS